MGASIAPAATHVTVTVTATSATDTRAHGKECPTKDRVANSATADAAALASVSTETGMATVRSMPDLTGSVASSLTEARWPQPRMSLT